LSGKVAKNCYESEISQKQKLIKPKQTLYYTLIYNSAGSSVERGFASRDTWTYDVASLLTVF
jgi:hypothetical protein